MSEAHGSSEGAREESRRREQKRTAHNKRNNESQARARLVTSAKTKAGKHPGATFVVVALSSAELTLQSAICGPELGDPVVAAMLRKLIVKLVRDLRAGTLDLSVPLSFSLDTAQAITQLLKKWLAPAVLPDVLAALQGSAIIDDLEEEGGSGVSESDLESITSSELQDLAHADSGSPAKGATRRSKQSGSDTEEVSSGLESGLPVGVSLKDVLNLLCFITIWTDQDQILDAWRDGALVLHKDQLIPDTLQQLSYRDLHIIAWLIGHHNICGADEELQNELSDLTMQGSSSTSASAASFCCLRTIRTAHGCPRPLRRLVKGVRPQRLNSLHEKGGMRSSCAAAADAEVANEAPTTDDDQPTMDPMNAAAFEEGTSWADAERLHESRDKQAPGNAAAQSSPPRPAELAARHCSPQTAAQTHAPDLPHPDQENLAPRDKPGKRKALTTEEQDKVLVDYWAGKDSSNGGAAALLKQDFNLSLTAKQIGYVKERVFGKRSKKATLSQPDTAASDVQDQSQDKARRQTCKEAAEESLKRISASVTDMGQLASQLPDDLAVARELYRTASMQSKNAELSIKLRQALQKAALKLAGAIH